MEITHNRRRWIREVLNPPEIGVLYTGNKGFVPDMQAGRQPSTLFVDLLNRSLGGVILRTKWQIDLETEFYLQIHNALNGLWETMRVRAKWANPDPHRPGYTIFGVEFCASEQAAQLPDALHPSRRALPLPSDYEFFKTCELFRAIPRDAVCAVINALFYQRVKAGNRMLKMGAGIDSCYLIQSGSCILRVEKDGALQPAGRLHPGDIVGEMAILDDLPLEMHVDAETDLELWKLSRKRFDAICSEHPELRGVLTHLLIRRFESATHHLRKRLDPYRISDMTGEDPCSIIFKGAHASLKLPVTIKMLKHELALDKPVSAELKKQIQSSAGLNHPNLVGVYQLQQRYRTLFWITEYVVGETLRAMLDRWNQLPLQRITHLLVQACRGLDFAHRQGIIHGHITPGTLMVTAGDRLKILDFMIAPLATGAAAVAEEDVPYQAPEQLGGKGFDHRADLFALGIAAFEMITGRRFTAADELHELPRDPAFSKPRFPEILKRFVAKATAADPDQRFDSARQAAGHLQALADHYGLPAGSSEHDRRKIATLSLVFRKKDQRSIERALEQLNARIRDFDAEITGMDFEDL